MTGQWTVITLTMLLTVVNAVALMAVVRQIGLLHLRIKPLPALEGEGGPSPGERLEFRDPLWHAARSEELCLVGFFSPTCKHCGPVMPAFQAVARADIDVAVVLATEAEAHRAAEYLNDKKINGLHVIAEPGCFTRNDIPGAPFAVVVDGTSTVLSSGGVNTLEQVEWLIEKARAPMPAAEQADRVLPDEHQGFGFEGGLKADVR